MRQVDDLVARRVDGRGQPGLGARRGGRRDAARGRGRGDWDGRVGSRRLPWRTDSPGRDAASALDRQASTSARTTRARMNRASGRRERPLEAEDRRRRAVTIADPAAAPDRPRPVATIGDPAVASEDREPEQRHDRQPDRQADQQRPDEPGGRIDPRVARRDDQRDEDPDDARPAKKPRFVRRSRASITSKSRRSEPSSRPDAGQASSRPGRATTRCWPRRPRRWRGRASSDGRPAARPAGPRSTRSAVRIGLRRTSSTIDGWPRAASARSGSPVIITIRRFGRMREEARRELDAASSPASRCP